MKEHHPHHAPAPTRPSRAATAGFSLVELMVVILILGILGSFAALKLMDKGDEAKVAKALHDIGQIENAIKLFRLKNNRLPESLEEIASAFEDEEVPVDPWENEYIYRQLNKRDFDIISLGADGEDGGEEFDADLNRKSRKLKKKE